MNILKKQTISIGLCFALAVSTLSAFTPATARSEEHTSELQSHA